MCLLFLCVVLPYSSLDGDGMLSILLSVPSCMSLSVPLHPPLLRMAVGVSFMLSVVIWCSFQPLLLLLFIPLLLLSQLNTSAADFHLRLSVLLKFLYFFKAARLQLAVELCSNIKLSFKKKITLINMVTARLLSVWKIMYNVK